MDILIRLDIEPLIRSSLTMWKGCVNAFNYCGRQIRMLGDFLQIQSGAILAVISLCNYCILSYCND